MMKKAVLLVSLLVFSFLLSGCATTGNGDGPQKAPPGAVSPTAAKPAIAECYCADGTFCGQCSVTKPKYCNANSQLVDRCNQCGCNTNNTCNTNTQQCVTEEFSSEQQVEIIGYSNHAMEPFISRDGNILFFNNLNDAQDTSLYYATRVNTHSFQLAGEVQGVNGEVPHLDAVASMDLNNNFYFISTRGYPQDYRNVFTGTFSNGAVDNLHRVEGDFYIREPGWIIMDAEISPDGQLLFFVNSHFEEGGIPVEADIGVAHKVNGEFIVDENSGVLFANVNTAQNLEYAPSFASNGLEFFFTRLPVGSTQTQIFISRRTSLQEPFGEPELLPIQGSVPEAPSISLDMQTLYYHKMDGGQYRIYYANR